MRQFFRTYGLLVVVLCLVAAVYVPSLNNNFTNWDDPLHITENVSVTDLSYDSVIRHFVPTIEYMYHPITMLLYSIEWHIGSGGPFIFHFTSLLLHLLNVILVFLLFRKLLHDERSALLIALIFGVHAVNVEAVAWISGRKDILYGFFLLLGMNAYLWYTEGKRKKFLVLVYASFLLGLLSKPTMVIFPLTVVLIDWWQHRFPSRTNIIAYVPLFLISILYAAFTVWLSGKDPTAIATVQLYPWTQRIFLICASFVFSIGKYLLPVDLSALYGYPMVRSEMLPAWYYATPFVLLAIGSLVFYLREKRFLIFGVALYIIPLLLVSQIFPFHNSSLVADRYAYISTIGLSLLLVLGAAELARSNRLMSAWWNDLKNIVFVIIISILIVLSLDRVKVWKNGEILFTDVIAQNKEIWLAYGNRAAARIAEGKYSDAVDDCNEAIQLHSKSGILYFNRGNALKSLENNLGAIADYDSAIALGYNKHTVYFNKGNAFFLLEQFDSAYTNFQSAKKIEPLFSQSYVHLGYLYLDHFKDPAVAKAYFDTASTKLPVPSESYYYRAIAEYRLGQFGDALEDLSRSIALFPSLRSDTLVLKLNTAIEVVRADIAKLNRQIDQSPMNKNFFALRSRHYLSLGDTVRAKQDEQRSKSTSW